MAAVLLPQSTTEDQQQRHPWDNLFAALSTFFQMAPTTILGDQPAGANRPHLQHTHKKQCTVVGCKYAAGATPETHQVVEGLGALVEVVVLVQPRVNHRQVH